jgi:hypothetical protein
LVTDFLSFFWRECWKLLANLIPEILKYFFIAKAGHLNDLLCVDHSIPKRIKLGRIITVLLKVKVSDG